MTSTPCRIAFLTIGLILALTGGSMGQTFRASFDGDVKADRAAGRAEPWLAREVELVPGRFDKAAQIGPRGQLVYAGEKNILAGRGTLALWCRTAQRPGPRDIQRLVFVQAKERGYWNYLAAVEWQESVFRAMVFDFYHGHGLHDPSHLPGLAVDRWHHLALVWDQAAGTKFYLDGKLAGSTWGQQAWWERPTPHAIHLSCPNTAYDELCVYDEALSDEQILGLATANQWQISRQSGPPDEPSRERWADSAELVGREKLPAVTLRPATEQRRAEGATAAREKGGLSPAPVTVIRQVRLRQVLDDRIPSWKVVDGRMNLFWPEWRAPVLGDVDFSGSRLRLEIQPGQQPTHVVLRGLVGGCRLFGERDGYTSSEPIVQVPEGLHFFAADTVPAKLTAVRIPRREGMKLHEVCLLQVEERPAEQHADSLTTPITGSLTGLAVSANQAAGGQPSPENAKTETTDSSTKPDLLDLDADLKTRCLPFERLVFGKASSPETGQRVNISGMTRFHVVSQAVEESTPLDALELRLTFEADWREDLWLVRVRDPVNPQRDLIAVPVRLLNSVPGTATTLDLVLDFWDIMLDARSPLRIELLPTRPLTLLTGSSPESSLVLLAGQRRQVLDEFAHTQSQLAYSYWQLGSEGQGSRGADPDKPGFDLLGGITHNRETKLTLEWLRRHVPDHELANNLWRVIYNAQAAAEVAPRSAPGAPEWAVWGRELLERYRWMAHHWADWQGPDGQVGGGWNDDTDFPGVFLCLPLLGDQKTQTMFVRIFDGLEQTGFLQHGISRSPTDPLHATDFLSWRAHLMLFDYGQPRHVERALVLTRELRDRWTTVDAGGRRRFISNHYGENGPGGGPNTRVDSAGLVSPVDTSGDSSANRNFLRDAIFCAWYSRNPAVLKFLREVAEADYAEMTSSEGSRGLDAYRGFPLLSYYRLFGEAKYIDAPLDRRLSEYRTIALWRRLADRLPGGDRFDHQVLASAKRSGREEQLAAAYWISKDKSHLVEAVRAACQRLAGGWQFRGGPAGGANDHFSLPGLAALSQMYLGGALSWLRPASVLPPIACSWEGLDDDVAAIVLDAGPTGLRVAAYNFDDTPRAVRMRVWELEAGHYRLRIGSDRDQDDRIDGGAAVRELTLRRATPIELLLPPHEVQVVELEQLAAQPQPDLLPDLAVGQGDIFYDKATDRLKVIVHNIGAAAAEGVSVRFQDPAGNLLGTRVIERLDAPLDLSPKTTTVYLPQPTLLPCEGIVVSLESGGQIEEITDENNKIMWRR